MHGKVNSSMYRCVSLIPAHTLAEHGCILIKVTFCSAVGINAGRSLLMSDDPAFHSLLIALLPRKEILWLCLMSVDKVKNSFYVGATDVSRKMLFHQLVHACGLFVVRETASLPNSIAILFGTSLIKFGHCFNAKAPATILPTDAFVQRQTMLPTGPMPTLMKEFHFYEIILMSVYFPYIGY